jgi:protein-S-isoprenylcysteine O-methyltransferase Ste14
MKVQTLLGQYLLVKPVIRIMIEWPIMIIVGILGEILSWSRLPLSPYSNFIGAAIFIGAWVFHARFHKAHTQAHEQSRQIEGIVTTGVFSKIRHPMYLSLIVMYLGLAIAWGIVWMLIPTSIFSALTVMTAVKEEEFLLKKFGHKYEEYMQQVPWRLIPRVF